MTVRAATGDDHLDVLRIVNGAMLEIDATAVEEKIESGDVLVAEDEGRPLGAAVLNAAADRPTHIEAIAVRRARRGQGIGGELVAAAVEREGALTADFAPRVRPFYESLGFEIEEGGNGDEPETGGETEGDGRLWGRFESED
ncbi:GNAT family N-acetyltransferase (plasmid) [Haladaptatus sp. SPP-AMP-3]|uniref:GNAT family N-acetyltransferase n=1 Tax=Haladaptatus sp. SPP-AMP-3 TaxID=3121295 RepID=UPI003C30817F